MKKKGQVTLFVILAIVIVVGASLFFIFRGDKGTSEDVIPDYASDVKIFVDSCIENAVFDSVYFIGENGGYYELPEDAIGPKGGVYYFYNDRVLFPSLEDVENNLKDFVESEILDCTNGFSRFSDRDVVTGQIDVDVVVENDGVLFDVVYPITIRKGEEITQLSNFGQFDVEVRLGAIHSVVAGLIEGGFYSSKGMCISCLGSEVYVDNLRAEINEIDNEKVFFIYDSVNYIDLDNITHEAKWVDGEYIDVAENDRIFKYVFAADY